MKKLLFIILITFFSCVGSDTTFLPHNITEARKQNLLVTEFNPTKKSININNSKYSIEQAFTTTKFNSKNDRRINANFFAFVLVIKNLETGAYGLDFNNQINYDQFIKFDCKTCGGIVSDNIVITYDNFNDRKKLDSVKIGFIDSSKKEEIIVFTKK